MICQECNQRPATLHFTKIINGEKTEIHLCEQCAKDTGEKFMFGGASGFSINNLLAGLLNVEPGFSQAKQEAFKKEEIVQCEHCSMTFQQFIKVGRFGCSGCYETFKEQLKPILRRLHSGNSSHTGKIPKRIGGSIHLKKKIDELKIELKHLINQEEFEKAAEIRDEIRSLENSLKQANEGGE
ncbi:UvrB/UvrC motif-containing protein [Cytobacillus spongiae]|jgi:protein arginine kinase activator|uniref:UvrB/UvrC motif-containing protein n=1 Tax=Cytobacillus spongiae TaxID=2901381 RepID=UPI001F187560|nr:UvrB/UvrC motif-containing protein [Cytobacillus spongiae]UII56043.1 UvrB/UvrC motif-containing protein [Cytobacillus spongiae]